MIRKHVSPLVMLSDCVITQYPNGRFRTAQAQRAHSANYYGVYPGNIPENHPPTEACMTKFLVYQQGLWGAEFRTHGKQQANRGGKQPTFRTARAQRTVRPPMLHVKFSKSCAQRKYRSRELVVDGSTATSHREPFYDLKGHCSIYEEGVRLAQQANGTTPFPRHEPSLLCMAVRLNRTFFNGKKKAGVSSWQPNLHIMATAVPPGGRWMIGGG